MLPACGWRAGATSLAATALTGNSRTQWRGLSGPPLGPRVTVSLVSSRCRDGAVHLPGQGGSSARHLSSAWLGLGRLRCGPYRNRSGASGSISRSYSIAVVPANSTVSTCAKAPAPAVAHRGPKAWGTSRVRMVNAIGGMTA
jgi:hypothetical protein